MNTTQGKNQKLEGDFNVMFTMENVYVKVVKTFQGEIVASQLPTTKAVGLPAQEGQRKSGLHHLR